MILKMVEGEISIKQFMAILMVIAIFFISGCTEKDKIDYFSTKAEALKYFIEKENVEGNIDLIITTKGENLLVVQSRKDVFFVGELIEERKGYYAKRISDSVGVGIGASWELNTMSKNKYTIFFEQNKEDANYIQFSNGEYHISLVDGHRISEEDIVLTNVIKEVETVKD